MKRMAHSGILGLTLSVMLLGCAGSHSSSSVPAEGMQGGCAPAESHQYDQAIIQYTKILEEHPGDVRAYFYRGNAYADKGLYDQALADYTKATEFNPQWAEAYNNMGFVYLCRRQYDQAIGYYTKAIELNPRLVEAYVGRGIAHADKCVAVGLMRKEVRQSQQGCGEYPMADHKQAIKLDPRAAKVSGDYVIFSPSLSR